MISQSGFERSDMVRVSETVILRAVGQQCTELNTWMLAHEVIEKFGCASTVTTH